MAAVTKKAKLSETISTPPAASVSTSPGVLDPEAVVPAAPRLTAEELGKRRAEMVSLGLGAMLTIAAVVRLIAEMLQIHERRAHGIDPNL